MGFWQRQRRNKAKLFGIKNEIPECVEQMEHALLVGSDETLDAELHYLLLTLYRMQNDFAKMRVHADALAAYDSRNPYALGAKYFQALAAAQEASEAEKTDLYKEAVRYYRNLALEHPEQVESYIYRAVCYRELGEYEKALEAIDYVMLLQESGKLWVLRGNILMDMGRIEEAKDALGKAEKLGENIDIWKEVQQNEKGGSAV